MATAPPDHDGAPLKPEHDDVSTEKPSPHDAPDPLPPEPSHPTALNTGAGKTGGQPADGAETARETPQTHGEHDIPSDGPDREGEAMIRELPKNPGLEPDRSAKN